MSNMEESSFRLTVNSFISLGSADRAFLTPDPSSNSLLPIDDTIWEENVRLLSCAKRYKFDGL